MNFAFHQLIGSECFAQHWKISRCILKIEVSCRASEFRIQISGGSNQ